MLYHGRVDCAERRARPAGGGAGGCKRMASEFRLLISGIGPTYDETAAAILHLGLPDCVEMTGYIDYEDGAGPSTGGPSIFVVSDLCGGVQQYDPGGDGEPDGGRVVPLGRRGGLHSGRRERAADRTRATSPGLTEALRRVLRDGALRDRLAEAALVECRAVYSWPKVAGQIMDVYARLRGTDAGPATWDPLLPMTPCRFRAEPHSAVRTALVRLAASR